MTTIDNQFDNECPFVAPDHNKEYYYYKNNCCKGFTKLMKYVLLTKKNPAMENIIEKYITKHPEVIDIKSDKQFTAFFLACRNMNGCSTENTIKILIKAGANTDLRDINRSTAIFRVFNARNYETVKLLIELGCNYDSIIDYEKSIFALMPDKYGYANHPERIEFQKYITKKIFTDMFRISDKKILVDLDNI